MLEMVHSLNLHSNLVFLALFIVYYGALGDLNMDIQALLTFSAYVPHVRMLNWNYSIPICTSWIGITCNENGTHVVSLRLPGVGLYGPIPFDSIGRLNSLAVLSLRSNHLSGNLPSDLSSLPSLRHLYLQHNNFSGNVPNFLSPKMRVLDLSFNSFSGSLPRLDFPHLRHVNLSYNILSGTIPPSLRRFPASSFAGNSLLCGLPLNRCSGTTPSPPALPKRKSSQRKLSAGSIVAIAIGSSVAIFFLVFIILFCFLRKKGGEGSNTASKSKSGGRSEKSKEEFGSGVQEAEKNKLVFFGGSSYNFDLEDLLRASAEVLGKGSYGTAYKAILEEGTTVVVKRLKEVVVGKREFEQQMDMIGGVDEHPHVVPLRAYYYSKDEKLLVYDYIPKGSLSTLLHGNEEGRQLDWESRLKISVGTARGLAHIHSSGIEKFVHGNIKSSNVLLSDDMTGRISDYGLTPLISFPIVPSRGAGYRAPEVIETRKPTQKSDVYSFGVLLLEMLTGKAPVQSPRRDDIVDLPRWVQSVVREEWTAEVFDVELMKYPNIEEELVQMLQIALACVAKVPDMRPKMEEVVRMVEEIHPTDSENLPSSEDNKATSSIVHTP